MNAHDGPEIRIHKLSHFDGLSLPSYATAGAAGMDEDGGKDEDEDEGMVEGPGGPTNARIQMKVSTRAASK